MRKARRKHRMFPISKPYGYHIPDVEKTINGYREVVDKLKRAIHDRDQVIQKRERELEKLKLEFNSLKIEISSLELPNMSHFQKEEILNRFKSQRPGSSYRSDDQFDEPELEQSEKIIDLEDDLEIIE